MSTHTILRCDSCHEQIKGVGYSVASDGEPDHDVHSGCLGVEIDDRLLSHITPRVTVTRFSAESAP